MSTLSTTLFLLSGTLFLFFRKPKKTLKKPPISETELEKKKFDEWFYQKNVNQNIQPELYQSETWKNINQSQENIWKTRILFHSGTKGNIIMFYDLYRKAFAYYSDTHISYPYLNVCAMKYVRLFSCRDFYTDTFFLPKDFVSPFLSLIEEEELLELENKKSKKKSLGLDFDSSAFVSNKKKEPKIETKIEYQNTFRYLGKISNHASFLQKSKPKIVTNPDLFNYSMFKSLKKISFFESM
jgi:hypothetical protein